MGLTLSEPDSVRAKLWQLLGDIPPTRLPEVHTLGIRKQRSYTLEHFTFRNGLGDAVYGYLLLPDGVHSPSPAVLYHHGHGFKYDLGKEVLLHPRDNGYADGIALVEAGFIVLGIDTYAFGERQQQGPAGQQETGAATELSLFKHFLWHGRTLWGMMLHDDLLALAYLRSRPEVDPSRIGTTGMSLGGSQATWVAALDGSIQAVIPIGQMTRYTDFAATGNYNLHSIYYFVPNMLRSGIDMEHIVALVAPHYQRILIGKEDPLSPYAGVQKVYSYARKSYAISGAENNLELLSWDGIGHSYTADMHQAMLDGFMKSLKP